MLNLKWNMYHCILSSQGLGIMQDNEVRRVQETEMVNDDKETVSLGHSMTAAYMIKTVLPHTLYETLPLFGNMD